MVLKPTNSPGLYKDSKSGAIVNKNEDQLLSFQVKREKAKTDLVLRQTVEQLKQDVALLKETVRILSERITKLDV